MVMGRILFAVALGGPAIAGLWPFLGVWALPVAPLLISAIFLASTIRPAALRAVALGAVLGFTLGLAAIQFNAPAAIFVWLLRYGVFG